MRHWAWLELTSSSLRFFVALANIQLAHQRFQIAAGQHGMFLARSILDLCSEGESDVPDTDIGQRQLTQATACGVVTDDRPGSAQAHACRKPGTTDRVDQRAGAQGFSGRDEDLVRVDVYAVVFFDLLL